MKRCLNEANLRIVGAIDLSHPTRADLRADFVTAEFGAGVKSHFFKSALQLITTASDDVASAMRLMKRKRCPSVDTS